MKIFLKNFPKQCFLAESVLKALLLTLSLWGVVHQEIAPHTTYFCCLTVETCPARVYWTLGGVMQGYNEEVLHWNIRRVSSLSKGESFLTTVWVNGWLHLRSWITRRTLFYYSQLRRRFFRKKSSLPDLRLKTMNLVSYQRALNLSVRNRYGFWCVRMTRAKPAWLVYGWIFHFRILKGLMHYVLCLQEVCTAYRHSNENEYSGII